MKNITLTQKQKDILIISVFALILAVVVANVPSEQGNRTISDVINHLFK